MTRAFKSLLKRMLISSTGLLVFVGAWISFHYFYTYHIYDGTPVRFENGFVYTRGAEGGKVILRSDGRVAVESNVRYVEAGGNFVYGFRRAPSAGGFGVRYYFVCQSGENCAGTQTYGEEAFAKVLEEKNLSYCGDCFWNPLMWAQLKAWAGIDSHNNIKPMPTKF